MSNTQKQQQLWTAAATATTTNNCELYNWANSKRMTANSTSNISPAVHLHPHLTNVATLAALQMCKYWQQQTDTNTNTNTNRNK